MLKVTKNIVLILLIVLAILILEYIVIWTKLNYFQIENGNETIKTYEEKYIVETILFSYIDDLSYAKDNYKEFSNVFNMKSNISKDDIKKIVDIYELEYYSFEVTIVDIVKLSDNQFKCKYSLKNTTESLVDGTDGTDVKTGEVKEEVEYFNEIIIDVNIEKNAYKVLYNKFDLGGGEYYEK